MELEFDEALHQYKMGGIIFPSVTQVMQPLHDKVYGTDISPMTMEKAADRGTRVHRSIEQYEKFGFKSADEDCKPYFDAYLQFKHDFSLEVIASEKRFYHKAFMYAGTCDLIMQDGEINILADIKTTQAVHRKMWAVQLAAYAEGLKSFDSTLIHKVGVIHLKKDGTYTWYELKPDFSTFLACLQIHNFKEDVE